MRLLSLTTQLLVAALSPAVAQTFGPDFAADYSFSDLGNPVGIPSPLGGLNFAPGDPDTLWIGGAANSASGAIYSVPVTRDATGSIASLGGPATLILDAPNIDGGVAFSPDGVLFVTTFPNNQLLQYLPGSTQPDKVIDLTAAGVSASTGTCQFVPAGFAGAGGFKIASFSLSDWFDVTLQPDGFGTYDITSVTLTDNIGGGPEGIVYVMGGNPGFADESVLVSKFTAGSIAAFEIDANGDPIVASERPFFSGLGGAEGAVIDPLTGDFLFTTFGAANRVIVVDGFSGTSVYCDGKVSSRGCVPAIGAFGSPTVSGLDDFELRITDLLNDSFGLLIVGTSPAASPLGGGVLCIGGTIERFTTELSGGNMGTPGSDCSGSSMRPITQARMASAGWAVGQTLFAQYLSRDGGFPSGQNLSLSDALRFTLRP